MICAMKWIDTFWTEADNARTNCDLVAMGHSRGGEAAFQVIQNFPDLVNDTPRRLAAAVGIAPRSDPESDEGSFPIAAERAVPYLIVMGGSDEDVGGGDAARAYDIMASEESETLVSVDKLLLWAYDVPHNAWGGVEPTEILDPAPKPSDSQFEKGRAIGFWYIPAFLRWQVLGQDVLSNRSLFTALVKPSANLSEFPGGNVEMIGVQDPAFWQHLQPSFMELNERPLIFADFSLGATDGSVAPLRVDTMVRPALVPCGSLSPASGNGSVMAIDFEPFEPTQVCVGSAADLSSVFSTPGEHHETSVMRITWGNQLSAGRVRWSLDTSLADFSFVSLRIGQSYDPAVPSAVEARIVLHGTDQAAQPLDVPASLGLQIRQDDSELVQAPQKTTDFMHTVRVPLQDFCAAGLDLTTVDGLSIVVSPSVEERSLLIDSIEFTRAPEDGQTGCN